MKHLIALSLGTLALGIAEFGMMAILTPLAQSLGVTIAEAGHFISSYASGVCAGVVLMVLFGRKLPLKTFLLVLAGLIFAGNALTIFADSYFTMLAARFIAGLPHGAYFGVGAIVATQLAKPGCAQRDVCLMVAGMTVANMAGVPGASFLTWALGWQSTYIVISATAALLFISLLVFVPKLPALPDKGFLAQFHFLGEIKPWLVIAAIGLGNGGFFAFFSYINPVAHETAHVPEHLMSFVVGFCGFAMVAGNLISARLSKHFTDAELAFAGQAVLCLSLVIVMTVSDFPLAVLAAAVVAAGCVFFISGPEQILILKGAGDGQLLAAALGQVAFNFGNAMGAWVGGLPIEEGMPAYMSAFPGALLACMGFILLFLVWRIQVAVADAHEAARS